MIFQNEYEKKLYDKPESIMSTVSCTRCNGSGHLRNPSLLSEWEACPDCDANGYLVVTNDLKERIAINLWHRFAPEGHMEWSEETHAAEYRDAADAVLFLVSSSKKSDADSLRTASLKKLADGCRIKADLYAKAHPEIPASFRIIAQEIDLIAAGASALSSHHHSGAAENG